LTANLQLRPCHNRHAARLVIRGRPAAAFGSRSPKRPREGCITVLAEPRSTAPPRCTSRGTVFSTARRACDLTSDVLCRDLLRTRITLLRERPHPHRFGSPGPPPPASRQRRRLSSDQDAFHRRVLPPPVAHRAFARFAWDHEEPATGIAARVLVAFATATRLPTPLHPLRSHAFACERGG